MTTNRTAGGAGVPNPDVSPTADVSWEAVRRWRMERHHLTSRVPGDRWLDVVRDICGLHAQVASSATLSLAARVRDVDESTLERACWEERSLVKTWAVRGTLHLLPADEYPVWQAFVDAYRGYETASWRNYFGFTEVELEQVLAAITDALDGRQLTREALAADVARRTGADELGEKLEDNWGATLKPAASQGRLCYAKPDGGTVRFARPDQWLGPWEPVDTETAVAELTRRYLAAYGPVTREQYARWAGISDAMAGRRIEALGEDVSIVELDDGGRAWLLTEDVEAVAAIDTSTDTGAVRLLPRFDPFVVGGPRDEPAVIPPDHEGDVFQSNGWIAAVLVADGRVAGVWDHDRTGDELSITVEPFVALEPWVRDAAHEEGEVVAAALGADVIDVTFVAAGE